MVMHAGAEGKSQGRRKLQRCNELWWMMMRIFDGNHDATDDDNDERRN